MSIDRWMDKEDVVYMCVCVCLCVLVAQLCQILCDPMDCGLPGSSIHGIFQARILEWVAISFSRGSSQPRDRIWVSHIVGRLFIDWARDVIYIYMASIIYMIINIYEFQYRYCIIYNGILLSHKKEWNNAICRNTDGPRYYHPRWSKSDKDKYHMILITCGIQKKKTQINLFAKQTQTQKVILWLPMEKDQGKE